MTKDITYLVFNDVPLEHVFAANAERVLPTVSRPQERKSEVEYSFYWSPNWPNELGDNPDDLVGRLVRQNGQYFKVESHKKGRFIVTPQDSDT